MSRNWLRRSLLLSACAASLLLAACGSGTIESQLAPARIVSFGDGFADVGQNGSRYTVNDGLLDNWTQEFRVAARCHGQGRDLLCHGARARDRQARRRG
jgi:hypothetical protein